jgi:hypothetical protein
MSLKEKAMNLKRIFFVIAITTLLLAMTTQVFASTSVNAPLAKPTKKSQPTQVGEPPSTPGANGAENSNKPDKARGKHEHYKGTIANIDPSSITLTLKDGSSVTIGLSAETRIKVASLKDATAAAIQTGMMATVQAIRDQSSRALTARMVVVIPGKPTRSHGVGWVTQYSGASITIQAHDGNSYTFLLSGDTKILPEERAGELAVGSRVTIIAPRDPSSTQPTAKGIVVHPAGSGEGSMPATQ